MERGRDDVRLRPDVNYQLDILLERVDHRVPQPLRMIDPAAEDFAAGLRLVAGGPGSEGKQGRLVEPFGGRHFLHQHARPIGNVSLPDDRRVQRGPPVLIAFE